MEIDRVAYRNTYNQYEEACHLLKPCTLPAWQNFMPNMSLQTNTQPQFDYISYFKLNIFTYCETTRKQIKTKFDI